MKKNVLLFFLIFWAYCSFGQYGFQHPDGGDAVAFEDIGSSGSKEYDLTIYPNPATDFINFDNTKSEIERVVIYSLVGRKVKEYNANGGKNTYDVSELANGMYLIQLIDKTNKIVKTQRVNKR